jgi:hypothetical protein
VSTLLPVVTVNDVRPRKACPLGFNTRYTDGVGAKNYIAAALAGEEAMAAKSKKDVFAAWGKF